MIADKYVG